MDIQGYRDIAEIGRGRASTVYRAVQDTTGRAVAIKVLSVTRVEDRLRRRFEREMAVSRRLSGHPNIAEVIELGYTADGHPFLTTPFYEHGSLDDRLARSGPLPVADVMRIGARLAGALDEVHRAGILHRDIKPSNVLEGADGEPALTGFGISAIDPDAQAMTMAQSFAAVHTPPEVILGQAATEATDTYQLGSTLYTLLAGHAPFQAVPDDGIVALLGRIQSAEVPEVGRPDIPHGLMAALRAALAKDPGARPGPLALADALYSQSGGPSGRGSGKDGTLPPVAPTAPATPPPVAVPPPPPPADPYGAAEPMTAPAAWASPSPVEPVYWAPPPPPAPPAPTAVPAAAAPPGPAPQVPVPQPPAPRPDPAPTTYLHPEPPLPPELTATTYLPPLPSSPAYGQTVRYSEHPTQMAPMAAPPDPPRPTRRGCGGRLVVALVLVAVLAAGAATVALMVLAR